MQNLIQKFSQSTIVFDKPDILSENMKTLTSSNYPRVQHFLLKLGTRLLLTRFLLSYLPTYLFANINKTCFPHTRFLHLY